MKYFRFWRKSFYYDSKCMRVEIIATATAALLPFGHAWTL